MNNRSFRFFKFLLAIIFVAVVFLPQIAHAQLQPGSTDTLKGSAMQCSNAGGSWSNATITCTMPSGVAVPSITIYPGATLIINNGDIITGVVSNVGGTLTVNGAVNVTTTGRLSNTQSSSCGSMTISGTVTNHGEIDNSCAMTNTGNITNTNGAYIYGYGGNIYNRGTMTNLKGGSVQVLSKNTGDITNSGTFNNRGWLALYGGDTVTYESYGFSGSFTSTGDFALLPGGTLTVGYGGYNGFNTTFVISQGIFNVPEGANLFVSSTGTVNVSYGAQLAVNGNLTTQKGSMPGTFNNQGNVSIGQTGIVNNNGTLVNQGRIINNNYVNNFGTLVLGGNHTGRFFNYQNATMVNNATGQLLSQSNGKIYNSGKIINQNNIVTAGSISSNLYGTNATIVNYGSITNTGKGLLEGILNNGTFTNYKAIANNGTFVNTCSGVFTNKGTVSGNPINSTCKTGSAPVSVNGTGTNSTQAGSSNSSANSTGKPSQNAQAANASRNGNNTSNAAQSPGQGSRNSLIIEAVIAVAIVAFALYYFLKTSKGSKKVR